MNWLKNDFEKLSQNLLIWNRQFQSHLVKRTFFQFLSYCILFSKPNNWLIYREQTGLFAARIYGKHLSKLKTFLSLNVTVKWSFQMEEKGVWMIFFLFYYCHIKQIHMFSHSESRSWSVKWFSCRMLHIQRLLRPRLQPLLSCCVYLWITGWAFKYRPCVVVFCSLRFLRSGNFQLKSKRGIDRGWRKVQLPRMKYGCDLKAWNWTKALWSGNLRRQQSWHGCLGADESRAEEFLPARLPSVCLSVQ